jgi:hypothetical protein
MTSFMEELLQEVEAAEERRHLELTRTRADEALGAVAVLESELEAINRMCDEEQQLIEEYRTRQMEKLQKRISWIAFSLEQYARTTGMKTIELPRGELRLRQGKAKLEVIDPQVFLPIAERKGLLRIKPETKEPDMLALHTYVKQFGVPPGVALTPATVNFSYKTKGNKNGKQQAQVGSDGNTVEAEVTA